MGDLSVLPSRASLRGREPSSIPYYSVLVLLGIFALGPILILIFNAFKTNAAIAQNPLSIPFNPVLSNFPQAWEIGNYSVTLLNSAIITAGTVLGVCIVAGLAAYAMTRLDLPGGTTVILYLFVCSAIPQQIFLIPLFFLWTDLNLVDTRIGLIIIYIAVFSPFATLLLRSYLQALPRDFEDVARTEGASELQVLTRIVLPLTLPGFLTIALISGLMAWNELLFAVTFLQDDSLKPVTTSFLAFQNQFSQDWGLTSAGAIFVMLPVIVLFLFLQRRFISGLAAGGLK